MRIAVFSDIHANLESFQACLEDAHSFKPDFKVMLGDYSTAGVDPAACWQLAKTQGDLVLQGNHERYLYELYSPLSEPDSHSVWFSLIRWSHQQLSPSVLEEMRHLPIHGSLPDAENLLFVHASLKNDRYSPLPEITAEDFRQFFSPTQASLIIRGHNHEFKSFDLGHTRIEQVSSVGYAFDESKKGEYAILEQGANRQWRVIPRSIDYPRQEMLRRFRENGLLETGVVARLIYLELKLGKRVFFPFMHAYRAQIDASLVSIDDAYQEFITNWNLRNELDLN